MPNRPKTPAEINLSRINDGPSYYVMGSNQAADIRESAKALQLYDGIQRSQASILGLDLSNLQPNVSARPGYDRRVYDAYRPSEAIPRRYTDILNACQSAYNSFGIVKNVIDLISDFASDGIRISHPKPGVQKFLREWFDRVNGEDRSERFLNCLYKLGTVVVRMQTANVPLKDKRKIAKGADLKISDTEIKLGKREIPWKYTFLHPGIVKNAGGPLAAFLPKQKLFIEIPSIIKHQITKLPKESEVLKSIPADILRAVNHPNRVLPLEEDRTFIYYFKRDDWEERPLPLIYPILKHLFMLEKLALADSSALDGAISNIRIFKLGSLENGIAPTAAATAKLSEILEAHTSTGSMDLIWDAAISLEESKTDVHQFLGSAKYEPHLEAVNQGLGIPTTLSGSGTGTTNNFVSLKTLIKRLQYGRRKLREFWNEQLRFVQKAIGFKEAAILEFSLNDDFSEEHAHRRLLIELADRELISDELLRNEFGFSQDLEKSRLNIERKDRDKKKVGDKVSPYHDAQPELSLRKIALQKGYVTPHQAGVEIEEEEESPFDKQLEVQKQRNQGAGRPSDNKSGTGRPGRKPGSKDKEPRKTKKFDPKTRASIALWADAAQSKINDILKPVILQHFDRKNIRSLASEEFKHWEELKYSVLCGLDPFSEVTEELVQASLDNQLDVSFIEELNSVKSNVMSSLERELTADELHHLQSIAYANSYIDNE